MKYGKGRLSERKKDETGGNWNEVKGHQKGTNR